MYKMLLFIKKSDDPNIIKHFRDFTVPILNELSGKEINPAKVESSLLLEQKYTWFCEVTVDSRDEWNRLMASKDGKKLNKDLMDFHQSIDIIFVNDEEEL
jgi:uncharacterized protein (TIGR02118 family)